MVTATSPFPLVINEDTVVLPKQDRSFASVHLRQQTVVLSSTVQANRIYIYIYRVLYVYMTVQPTGFHGLVATDFLRCSKGSRALREISGRNMVPLLLVQAVPPIGLLTLAFEEVLKALNIRSE